MIWLVILIGVILAFIITGLTEQSEKESVAPQPTNISPEPTYMPHVRRYVGFDIDILRRRELSRLRTRRFPIIRDLSGLQQTNELNGEDLVKNWRISIQGLIRLANSNLSVAKHQLQKKQYGLAVQAASTSVENISRALIHCFGGKPNHSYGQEEALRMLTRRFQGSERKKFEKAIEIVANIASYNKKLKCLKSNIEYTHSYAYNQYTITSNPIFEEAEAKRILKSTFKTFNIFRGIIFRYFEHEIPELAETLPGCPRL